MGVRHHRIDEKPESARAFVNICRKNRASLFISSNSRWSPRIGLVNIAMDYRMLGRLQEALEVSNQTFRFNPDDLSAHLSLAITYGLLGREAGEAVKPLRKFSK